MTHVDFLLEAARYFENRPTGGEDRAYWSNVYNAENCRKIANVLRAGVDGWVTVPREPTFDMKMAGASAITLEHMKAAANFDAACDAWAAMIAASADTLLSGAVPSEEQADAQDQSSKTPSGLGVEK